MKRTTLSALCAAAMLFGISYTHAQTYAQFASTPTSEVSDDGGGQIGIGTSSPSAKLHVNGATGNNPIIRVSNTFNSPDYFVGQTSVLVSGTVPPTYSTQTRFVVSNMGYIGIGEAAPQAALDIIDKRAYLTTGDPLIDRRMIAMRDKDDNDLMFVANTGTGSTHGACLLIRAEPDFPGLVVWDGLTNARFAVAGDGSVCLGLDLSEQPEAQLDIRTITGRDYMVNVANPANTLPHFNVHSSGNIGIGLAATSSTAKLSVRGSIDMYYNSTVAPALRLATSGGVARHVITDADDNLVIDPGVGGGANDKVEIKGDVQISGKLSIGSTKATATTGAVFSNYKLSVDGQIAAKEIVVQTSNWQDTVFSDTYKLMELETLRNFIQKHKHLPEIPSEKEAIANGIELAEMNKLLLKKVEELTLHVIRLDAENKKLYELIINK